MVLDIPGLLAELTTAEKISLTLGADFWHTRAIERLGVPAVMVADGPHGLRKQPRSADHIGIGGSVPATCFPTASALASSWDPELVREVGVALGRECRTHDVAVLLGPGINIKRSPLCGRNFEYFSEDPHVTGVLASAWVEGVQSQGVGASLKHFAVNNQETDRLRVSARVGEQALHEIYLRAFEHVVSTAHPWTVMCSYNRINGVYASEDRWLLTETLRELWGWDGVVVSDWGAVRDRATSLAAGLDLEMPPNLGHSEPAVARALTEGSVTTEQLDQAVTRVLELVDRALSAAPAEAADLDRHHDLARRAARESIVMLTNDGILPLAPPAGSRVLVVGEFARTPRFQGAGSSQVNPTQTACALDELRGRLEPDVEVAFAPGFAVADGVDDSALADEAVVAAAAADVVLAFLGLPPQDESEGFDRTHIDLPADQLDLLARLAEVNGRIVAVLHHGAAVAVDPVVGRVGAALTTWLAGQASGAAVVDLLLGDVAPSGRLAETLPHRVEDNPSFLSFPGGLGEVDYGEGVFVGYRGYDARDQAVSFPFGHGLTYTSFEYEAIAVQPDGDDVVVEVVVRNTGARDGVEVVQLYVAPPACPVARPLRELRAFAKVAIPAGTSRTVRLPVARRDLAYWHRGHGWTVAPGAYRLAVGASSRDLPLGADWLIDAAPPRQPITLESTLLEWLADPVVGPALRDAVGQEPDGRPRGLLGDSDHVRIIGNFPMARLAAFPDMGFDRDLLVGVLAATVGPDGDDADRAFVYEGAG